MCDREREMEKEEMIKKINDLIKENSVLKEELATFYSEEYIKNKEKAKEYRFKELEELCKDLQNQHQQDCIRYNDMHTAFLKTVDELAMMRKHFGMGQ